VRFADSHMSNVIDSRPLLGTNNPIRSGTCASAESIGACR
jgi:hypothetical protein